MNTSRFPLISQKEYASSRFSPWLIAGVIVVLAFVTGILSYNSFVRERERMYEGLRARADVLIWALEGSARSMFGDSYDALIQPRLVEEIAWQPDVLYLIVFDASGTVLAHSDPTLLPFTQKQAFAFIDALVIEEERVLQLSAARKVPHPALWHVVDSAKGQSFEYVREFIPMRFFTPPTEPFLEGERVPSGYMMGEVAGLFPVPQYYVVVGFDMESFDAALDSDFYHIFLMAFLVTLCGVSAVGTLFFLQSYRQSRQMLEDTQALAAQVVSSLPVGLLTLDMQGRVTLCNMAGIGLLHDKRFGQSGIAIDSLPVADWQALIAELDQGEIILEREMDFFLGDGKFAPVSLSASTMRDRSGQAAGYLFIFSDYKEIKRLHKQLRLNERLTALGNLAAGVAHEIRNPLSSIKGYALYLAGKFDKSDKSYSICQMVVQEVERLNRVVSELLEMSRPATLALKGGTDMTELLQRALRLVTPDAEAKQLTLEFSGIENVPAVAVDSEKFTQALLNLLLNAVQATPEGGKIALHCLLEEGVPAQNTPQRLIVRIVDTGVGMSEETLASTFTPYFTTKASGTGLGMTISHQIIEQHGGEIQIYSRLGQGTSVSILLPVLEEGKQ